MLTNVFEATGSAVLMKSFTINFVIEKKDGTFFSLKPMYISYGEYKLGISAINGDYYNSRNQPDLTLKDLLYSKDETDVIENIYIYSPESQEIKGYFKANEIIKNSPNLIWEKYHNKSNWLKKDFNNYFKDNEAYAIRINGLIEFKFPFKINNFSMRNQFMYIEPDNTDINFLLNFK